MNVYNVLMIFYQHAETRTCMFKYNVHMIFHQHAVTRHLYDWLWCSCDLLSSCGNKGYVWLTMMLIWSSICMR